MDQRLGSNGRGSMEASTIVWCGEYIGEIEFTMGQLRSIPAQGSADDAVRAVSKEPNIKAQTDKWDTLKLVDELQGYGAWDEVELGDHDQNIQRMLWIAACDLHEEHHV